MASALSVAEAHPLSWDPAVWFGVPPAVRRRTERPWTASEFLYNALLLVVAFMVIVTAIYWPWINDDANCSSWCCRTGPTRTRHSPKSSTPDNRMAFTPQESKATLTQFSREQNGATSGSNTAVMILENLFTGLTTLSIPHQPLYTVSKLAAEVKSGDQGTTFTPVHKNRFPMVTMSGKQGTAEDIYMTVYMAQTLARENALLILNGLDDDTSPAFEALNNLVKDEIIDWQTADLYHHGDETWASARFKSIQPNKSVSEHLYDVLYRYLDLSGSPVRYYTISKEREEELRRAYKGDQQFVVHNITTAFHGAVLKVLFPGLTLVLMDPVAVTPDVVPGTSSVPEDPEEVTYQNALEFLRTFIL